MFCQLQHNASYKEGFRVAFSVDFSVRFRQGKRGTNLPSNSQDFAPYLQRKWLPLGEKGWRAGALHAEGGRDSAWAKRRHCGAQIGAAVRLLHWSLLGPCWAQGWWQFGGLFSSCSRAVWFTLFPFSGFHIAENRVIFQHNFYFALKLVTETLRPGHALPRWRQKGTKEGSLRPASPQAVLRLPSLRATCSPPWRCLIRMESARSSRPRGSGVCEWARGDPAGPYIPGLFLTTASMLITVFPLSDAQEAHLALFPANMRPWLAKSLRTTGLRLLGSIKKAGSLSRPDRKPLKALDFLQRTYEAPTSVTN